MPDEDQVTESEKTETSDSEEKEVKQETQDKEQSKQKEGEQDKEELFELPDKRKVDAKTLTKEWKENFYPEFTRRSQKLREYEKAEEEAKSRVEEKTREVIAKDDLLKDVDPSVKEAIIQIVKPHIETAIKGLQETATQQEKDKAFTAEMDTLEKRYPGKDGRPKFERSKILSRMRESDNRDFDPETVYEKMFRKELLDYEVKQALKRQKGGAQLETTGGEESGKPQAKTPKNWGEASKAARSRL